MRTPTAPRLAALAIAALAALPAAVPAAAAAPGSTAATLDTGCGQPATVDIVLSDPGAGIRGQLQSEYLRGIAGDWYPTVIVRVFDVGSPAFILSRLDSEYLRGISSDWYPELLACAGAPA